MYSEVCFGFNFPGCIPPWCKILWTQTFQRNFLKRRICLVRRSTNSYVRSVVSLTTHYRLKKSIKICFFFWASYHSLFQGILHYRRLGTSETSLTSWSANLQSNEIYSGYILLWDELQQIVSYSVCKHVWFYMKFSVEETLKEDFRGRVDFREN